MRGEGPTGQGRWQAKKLLEWAAKELTTSRRDLDLQFGDIQDWACTEGGNGEEDG